MNVAQKFWPRAVFGSIEQLLDGGRYAWNCTQTHSLWASKFTTEQKCVSYERHTAQIKSQWILCLTGVCKTAREKNRCAEQSAPFCFHFMHHQSHRRADWIARKAKGPPKRWNGLALVSFTLFLDCILLAFCTSRKTAFSARVRQRTRCIYLACTFAIWTGFAMDTFALSQNVKPRQKYVRRNGFYNRFN